MNILNTISYFIVQAVAGVLTLVGVHTPINPLLTVSLTPAPVAIVAGESATITWGTQGAAECTSADFDTNDTTSGSVTVAPRTTTTYAITCFDKSTAPTSQVASSGGVWEYVGSDLSDIFIFPGGDPSKNQIYSAMQDCPIPDPEGKQCSSNRRCKINETISWLVYTDIYRCSGGGTPPPPVNINAVGREITISVTPAQNSPAPTGGGVGQCTDTIDNDGDGRIDGADFGCQLPSASKESPNPQCSDGIDNNNNGLTDTADVGACSGPTDNNERFADGNVTLEAPTLVQRGETVSLEWSVKNVRAGSCTLSGTNGDSWKLTGTSGAQTSSAIQSEATYTLSCTDLNGKKVNVSKTVKIAPAFRED